MRAKGFVRCGRLCIIDFVGSLRYGYGHDYDRCSTRCSKFLSRFYRGGRLAIPNHVLGTLILGLLDVKLSERFIVEYLSRYVPVPAYRIVSNRTQFYFVSGVTYDEFKKMNLTVMYDTFLAIAKSVVDNADYVVRGDSVDVRYGDAVYTVSKRVAVLLAPNLSLRKRVSLLCSLFAGGRCDVDSGVIDVSGERVVDVLEAVCGVGRSDAEKLSSVVDSVKLVLRPGLRMRFVFSDGSSSLFRLDDYGVFVDVVAKYVVDRLSRVFPGVYVAFSGDDGFELVLARSVPREYRVVASVYLLTKGRLGLCDDLCSVTYDGDSVAAVFSWVNVSGRSVDSVERAAFSAASRAAGVLERFLEEVKRYADIAVWNRFKLNSLPPGARMLLLLSALRAVGVGSLLLTGYGADEIMNILKTVSEHCWDYHVSNRCIVETVRYIAGNGLLETRDGDVYVEGIRLEQLAADTWSDQTNDKLIRALARKTMETLTDEIKPIILAQTANNTNTTNTV